MTEFVAKTLQSLDVDWVVIDPADLHHFLLAGGVMARIEGLIHQYEQVVPPRIIGCLRRTVLD
ncbi:hypothetical protein MHEL_07040 [Mycolicibacterium helvum]|uniref:Uncharacterized protein n=1 Tax=Mycolicibacterium helvum TaxID=1534349 RepID=A0A7I7T1R7_9MYCO|nr:hypothetical protein MHEL_07040 [Mycolicibacterium helvum]